MLGRMIGSTIGGAAIGGISGVATGDNYDATSTFRNAVGGAMAGAGIGAGLTGLGAISNVARMTRGVGSISKDMGLNTLERAQMVGTFANAGLKQGTLKGIGYLGYRGALATARGVIGTSALAGKAIGKGAMAFGRGARTAYRYPLAATSAGAIGAGAYAWSEATEPRNINKREFSVQGSNPRQINTGMTNRRFQNSASGLAFGLHRGRHG